MAQRRTTQRRSRSSGRTSITRAVAGFYHSLDNTGRRGSVEGPRTGCSSRRPAGYVSKVDDDCLMPEGWADVLRAAHVDVPELGAVGCWRFRPEDVVPSLAREKIQDFGAHRIFRNCWIEGTGFLMKRSTVEAFGPMRAGTSFPTYCKQLAVAGWLHGWYYPFLHQEHMDDPRSAYRSLAAGAQLRAYRGGGCGVAGLPGGARADDPRQRAARPAFEPRPDPPRRLAAQGAERESADRAHRAGVAHAARIEGAG